jgi:hypothetical protein
MTPEAIADLCRRAGMDDVSTDRGAVLFVDRFSADDDIEPHDVASDRLRFWTEMLAPLSLRVANSGSDNDSVWGEAVRRAPDPLTVNPDADSRDNAARPRADCR